MRRAIGEPRRGICTRIPGPCLIEARHSSPGPVALAGQFGIKELWAARGVAPVRRYHGAAWRGLRLLVHAGA